MPANWPLPQVLLVGILLAITFAFRTGLNYFFAQDDFAFLARLLLTHPRLGSVAIHPYATADHAPDVHVPGEENFDDIQHVHDQLVAAGEQASIWVTEWGWSSAKR